MVKDLTKIAVLLGLCISGLSIKTGYEGLAERQQDNLYEVMEIPRPESEGEKSRFDRLYNLLERGKDYLPSR